MTGSIKMKRIIVIFAAVLAASILSSCIKSVDEYYSGSTETITPESMTVTLSIRCNVIFDNYDQLDPALKSGDYIPENGIILEPSEFVLREGDSVFDILERAVKANRIQMDYQGADQNPYGTVYVKGIHYIYEKSCGPLSGWIYRVDGSTSDIGCSNYKPEDGQNIEWIYSCALGTDAGKEWKKGEPLP